MFVFIVDRSGSMSGKTMEITKEAVILFIQSLPPGSKFEIISFGSNYRVMSKGLEGYDYNNENKKFAIDEVRKFSADLGGTEIYEPLEYMYNQIKVPEDYLLKAFLLTDGGVSSPGSIVNLIKEN